MIVKSVENEKLIRKQFLVSSRQAKKLSSLAAVEGKSEAEIVRSAIDAFEPAGLSGTDAAELMDLVSQRLKEAVESTQQANQMVFNTLQELER